MTHTLSSSDIQIKRHYNQKNLVKSEYFRPNESHVITYQYEEEITDEVVAFIQHGPEMTLYLPEVTFERIRHFKDGLQDGVEIQYHRLLPNKVRCVRNYKNGNLNGTEIHYVKDGYIVDNWKDGALHGQSYYFYSDGRPIFMENYVNYRKHGLRLSWYANRQLRTAQIWYQGKQYGNSITWYNNGVIWSISRHYNGNVIESQFHDDNGNLIQESEC